ncbi:MAG: DUF1566 domain-containing protein [Myxococcota bacterium]
MSVLVPGHNAAWSTSSSLVLFLVLGCSNAAPSSPGSNASAGTNAGGNTSHGGTSGGVAAANGGAHNTSGGTTSSGGATNANGGATNANGGATNANGGATNANGGATNTNGGTLNSNGGAANGGSSANAGAGNAGENTCWNGPTVTWTASDHISRKWARWPMPNSPASTLPRPMSYTATTDGILDRVTGLVWQKSTNNAGTTWTAALSYCTALGADWSLPTRIELTTILRHDASGAKVDTSIFSFGANAGWTWASTPWVVNQRKNLSGASALSWFINFAVGDSNNSLSQTNSGAYSRCVKIQPTLTLPAEHYTVSNGEVRDNYTCLNWQQASSGSTPNMTHAQAVAYCAGFTLNGQKWRLPSVNELATIVDDVPSGDVSPAIDHAIFPDTSPDQKYWTSSAYGAPASATTFWTLNFMDGFTQHPDAATLALARCVR